MCVEGPPAEHRAIDPGGTGVEPGGIIAGNADDGGLSVHREGMTQPNGTMGTPDLSGALNRTRLAMSGACRGEADPGAEEERCELLTQENSLPVAGHGCRTEAMLGSFGCFESHFGLLPSGGGRISLTHLESTCLD